MSPTAVALCICLLLASEVSCLPEGAPLSACQNIAPSVGGHLVGPQPANTLPYELGGFETSFATATGDELGYIPGQTYNCKISQLLAMKQTL